MFSGRTGREQQCPVVVKYFLVVLNIFYSILSLFSGRTGREQQCPGCICDSSGATGTGKTGEVISSEEDQTCGHDNFISTGQILVPS